MKFSFLPSTVSTQLCAHSAQTLFRMSVRNLICLHLKFSLHLSSIELACWLFYLLPIFLLASSFVRFMRNGHLLFYNSSKLIIINLFNVWKDDWLYFSTLNAFSHLKEVKNIIILLLLFFLTCRIIWANIDWFWYLSPKWNEINEARVLKEIFSYSANFK